MNRIIWLSQWGAMLSLSVVWAACNPNDDEGTGDDNLPTEMVEVSDPLSGDNPRYPMQ